ncbi:hypothetical protein TNCV_2167331 [Trichonephila clavipes]|nr:hypothetical protein TNCV_2167331 [Trichonephila clavipes]
MKTGIWQLLPKKKTDELSIRPVSSALFSHCYDNFKAHRVQILEIFIQGESELIVGIEKQSSLCLHIHHIWHSRECLNESDQTIGRLNKTCKNAHLTILISLGRNRRFGDNFATELQFIPLSNDTVARRNQDIAEDVGQQPLGMLRDKLSSIQLDEATDSN